MQDHVFMEVGRAEDTLNAKHCFHANMFRVIKNFNPVSVKNYLLLPSFSNSAT